MLMSKIARVVHALTWLKHQRGHTRRTNSSEATAVRIYMQEEATEYPELFAADVAKRLYACAPQLPKEELSISRYEKKMRRMGLDAIRKHAFHQASLSEADWANTTFGRDGETLGGWLLKHQNYKQLATRYDVLREALAAKLGPAGTDPRA